MTEEFGKIKEEQVSKKMKWEEYQERVKLVREAVIEDMNALNPDITVLKARLFCRDEEDRFDLACFEDFSPYMDGLYKRFDPDIRKKIQYDYEELKKWKSSRNCVNELKRYRDEVYSAEQICKKYYVSATKYVEIEGNLTILYSADFSMKGEVISVDDPTGYYRGFDYSDRGYFLSNAEKVISENLSLFRHFYDFNEISNLPYTKGDILYIDGSPYERPFYGVCNGDEFLYILDMEYLKTIERYQLPKREYPFPRIFLDYHRNVPPYYQIRILDSCEYKCLMEASCLIKKADSEYINVKEAIQTVFEEEFKEEMIPPQSGTRMKGILEEFSKVSECYPDMTFTGVLDKFQEWLNDIKTIYYVDIDDAAFLKLFTEYCEEDLNKREEERKKVKRLCEDRDMGWSEMEGITL